MKRLTIADVTLAAGLTILVAATLVPAVGRIQRSPGDAKCQSNLQRWTEAMALYCADNNGTYPTNRPWVSAGGGAKKLGSIMPLVSLSPAWPDPDGNPYKFVYGVNWVEALYDYIRDSAERTGQDWESFKRCPMAQSAPLPPANPQTGMFPAVTYTFNRNLAEYWQALVRQPRKVMMLREFPGPTVSLLRPANDSTDNPDGQYPMCPFLIFYDLLGPTPGWDLHAGGSHIAFADGHVKHFTIDFFPPPSFINKANCWDEETRQWYNYGPVPGIEEPYVKSIAITP